MSGVNFEVKKVKPKTKISDKQLEVFKTKEDKKHGKDKRFSNITIFEFNSSKTIHYFFLNDNTHRSMEKMVIPLLSNRTTIKHKLNSSKNHCEDHKKSRFENEHGVEIGENVRAGLFFLEKLNFFSHKIKARFSS